MLRYLLFGGIAALGGSWLYRHKLAPKAATPAQATVHGALMAGETSPAKLEHAARMFGAEGLTAHAECLRGKAKEVRKQARGAADLIERARDGDQNAMGLIAAVREQALSGSPRARVSCVLMARYCELRPMQELGPLGELPIAAGEDSGAAFAAAQRHGLIGSPFG